MRRRAHHRNLVVWSPSAGSAFWDGAPRLTRTRRIRRWIRTGALLMVIGLMRLARAARPRGRSEVERELAVFSHPAQRRLVGQAISLYDKRFPGFLSRNAAGESI